MTKPFSAAAYRAHAAKVNETAPTEVVMLKSGAVFELRRPDLQAYVMTGRLPQSLLNIGLKQWKAQGLAPATPESANVDDATDMLVFMRTIVEDATVCPKFVHVAINDNEIGAREMLPADFSEIFQWAMNGQGVTGPDGLQQFRSGQAGRVIATGVNRKKQRKPRKRPVGAL